ncbi:MAG: hypothetical protein R3Y35_00250 [Clostridia bacterium]
MNNQKSWDLLDIASDFIKPNTKILCLNFDDIIGLACNLSNVFLVNEGFDSKQIQEFAGIKFDLIISNKANYNIKQIQSLLSSGGHFLSEQLCSNDSYFKGERKNFNLENEYFNFKKNNFKIVRYNQYYLKTSEKIEHSFYILAKNL